LVDLANMTHVRPPKNWHTGCCESARELLPGRFAWFLSDRNLAKDSAGLAGRRPPTERWQDKRREVRSGRTGEEGKSISSLQRGAGLQPVISCKPLRHHGVRHLVGPGEP
jgi:hypothetical protein